MIIGDSWSVGEWHDAGHNELVCDRPSLDLALSDQFDVLNLSRGGASNWQSFLTAQNYLKNRPRSANDVMIVIQTDAMRMCCSHRSHVDFDPVSTEATDLINLYERLLEIFYIKLDDLARQHQTKIYLVGGLSDLAMDILCLYANLVPVCESWIRLMMPRHEISVVPLLIDADALKTIHASGRMDLLDEALAFSDRRFLQLQTVMETEYIGPAQSDFHPNSKGHQLLADQIKQFDFARRISS